jgi:hypothetical protein
MEYNHTWGECDRRGAMSGPARPITLPHLARPLDQTACRCAWCGAPCPETTPREADPCS